MWDYLEHITQGRVPIDKIIQKHGEYLKLFPKHSMLLQQFQ